MELGKYSKKKLTQNLSRGPKLKKKRNITRFSNNYKILYPKLYKVEMFKEANENNR